ncbi:MAG: hypothetical protein WCI17_08470 [bacterium]
MSGFLSLHRVLAIFLFAAGAIAAVDPAVRAPSTWPPNGQPTRVMISRDNWISAVGSEARGNCGGFGKMKLKGIQEFAVVDADLSGLRGKIVTGALLHFRCTTPALPARRVSISTVAGGVRQVVNLSGKAHKTRDNDAGTIRFDKADPGSLWALRTRVGAMVSARAPAYRRVARPMPTPPKDLANLPDIGYVTVAPPVPAAGPEL